MRISTAKYTLLFLGLTGCVVRFGGTNDAQGGAGAAASGTGGATTATRGGTGSSRIDPMSGGTSANGESGSTAQPTSAGNGGSIARASAGKGGSHGAASAGRGGTQSASTGGTGSGGKPAGGSPPVAAIKPPCSVCAGSSLACEGTLSHVGTGRAAAVATKLGRAHFLMGMGNDLDGNYDHNKDGAYTLGVTFDLHYAYLVGLPGMGGWPDWNQGGTFANILADSAADHCVTPMYTVYSMAAWGEGNLAGLSDASYMSAYWSAAKLLFQRIAEFDRPAVVQLEPDFWGFVQMQTSQTPAAQKVLIKNQAPDCADLPENLIGMGKCWIKLARQYAPKALVGFQASQWGGTAAETVSFFSAIGAKDSDLIVLEMLDRDAGCFEAAQDPNCQRQGDFYWDASNTKSPNFHEHLSYAKQVSDGLDKPILWWQIPFGVPSETPGGTAGHYRDNRVKYIFEHIDEFVAAGGMGVTFGVGTGNQTDWTTDGDQFKTAVQNYYHSPTLLP